MGLSSWAQAQPTLPLAPVTPQPVLRKAYHLAANDVVQVSVYQEADLDAKVRIARDGSVTLPLLGDVKLGGKTIEEATGFIRDKLKDGYLVNPQVTLTITEYAKRRFTIMGKVQRPGTYEMPDEQTVTLLQAVAAAGGYAGSARDKAIAVNRIVGDKKVVFTVDADAMAKNKDAPAFDIQPDDVITVPEKIF
jgi:protein involved in polysaccharide export with SLBB domain